MNKDISRNLRRIRQERGYGLVQAAEGIGISRGYLSKLENGVQYPSIPIIDKIAKFYGVDRISIMSESIDIEFLHKKYNITLNSEEITENELKVAIDAIKKYRMNK
ncbi:helix-turn-helix domain-containing protein [Bacillus stercoris]|uniref:helix-turn-helix domain-containing protein n=1 Tax=Bacillus stercoris TaxID=2054641 RepID=UPI003CFB317E